MELKFILPTLERTYRRALVIGSSSKPYLSGDLFAKKADYAFNGKPKPTSNGALSMLKKADVVFCESHDLELFLDLYSSVTSAKVLILGNSDRDFLNFNFNLPKSIRQVFAQNLYKDSQLIQQLPIGIENIRLAHNGMPKHFADKYIQTSKKNRVLVGPFSPTHNERKDLISLSGLSEVGIDHFQDKVSPTEYALLASQYRYIAAPRGNGLDTHRFWEALYRGSIPVVLANEWSKHFMSMGIPLVQVHEWSKAAIVHEINRERLAFRPAECAPLWWNYWKSKINDFC